MKIYFTLQGKRLMRRLASFGLNPVLGILLAGVAFVVLSVLLYDRLLYPQYVYALLPLALVYPLGNARRNEFLKSTFTVEGYKLLRGLENFLLAFPFAAFLLYKNQYLPALAAVAAGTLLSLFNWRSRSGYVVPTPFYRRPFEFTVGFRETYGLIILLYGASITGIAVANYALGVAPILLMLLVCLKFYDTPEPPLFVWMHAQSSRDFLHAKIQTAVRYGLLLVAPVAVLMIGLYPLNAYIVLLILLLGLLYVVQGVVSKYASFPEPLQFPEAIKITMGILFPPVLLVLIPHFYVRALKKLKIYLK